MLIYRQSSYNFGPAVPRNDKWRTSFPLFPKFPFFAVVQSGRIFFGRDGKHERREYEILDQNYWSAQRRLEFLWIFRFKCFTYAEKTVIEINENKLRISCVRRQILFCIYQGILKFLTICQQQKLFDSQFLLSFWSMQHQGIWIFLLSRKRHLCCLNQGRQVKNNFALSSIRLW